MQYACTLVNLVVCMHGNTEQNHLIDGSCVLKTLSNGFCCLCSRASMTKSKNFQISLPNIPKWQNVKLQYSTDSFVGVKIGYEKIRKFPKNVFFEKRKDKTQRNRKTEELIKSSFVTIPKRIYKISFRARLLEASDNGSRTTKQPTSNPPNGRVGPNMLPSSHSRSSLFCDRSNRLLFRLDRGHYWNFTAWKPQRTRSLERNSDFPYKTATVN